MPASRKVSVALEVKAAAARRDIRETSSDVKNLEASVVAAGHGMDKMAQDAAQAGRAAEKMAAGERAAKAETQQLDRELGQLDRQIEATTLHLKTLGRQFAETGDKGLLKQIRAERSMLRQLQKIRESLGPDTPEIGILRAGRGPGLRDLLGALPAQLKGAAIAAAVSAAVVAAPALGAAIAGAVVGGVGLGGIVGGVALAAQDDRVRVAGSQLGKNLLADLQQSASPMIQPLLRSFEELEVTGASFTAMLSRGFTRLAPLIGPLTKGIDGLVRNLGPGLEDTFEAARPAIRALSNELPEIGRALSDMLSTISQGDRATQGLVAMLHATEALIRATGDFIGFLEFEFDLLVDLGAKLDEFKEGPLGFLTATVFGPATNYLSDEATNIKDSVERAKDSTNDWNDSLRDLRDTTAAQAAQLKTLNDAIDGYLDRTMNVREAQLRLKRQWDDTVETLREGKRTLDLNTEAGQDNMDALYQWIRAAQSARDAEYAKTGSLDAANRSYDAQLGRLRDLAVKLGFSKTKVDELVNSVKTGNAVGGLTVPVTMPGLDRYLSRLNYFIQQLGMVRGMAAAEFAEFRQGERDLSRNRWGGVYEHAAAGLLREAAHYSPSNPGRYMIAEPQTRGEAFIPKSGNYGRSMSILSRAASWYGASVVPHGQATAAAPVIQVSVTAGSGAGELARALVSTLRTEISQLGGDVQSALGSRARVGG